MEEQRRIVKKIRRLISNVADWNNVLLTIMAAEAIVYGATRWLALLITGSGFFLVCSLIELCFFQFPGSREERRARRRILLTLGVSLAVNASLAGLAVLARIWGIKQW
jgi:hypothetical protein